MNIILHYGLNAEKLQILTCTETELILTQIFIYLPDFYIENRTFKNYIQETKKVFGDIQLCA